MHPDGRITALADVFDAFFTAFDEIGAIRDRHPDGRAVA